MLLIFLHSFKFFLLFTFGFLLFFLNDQEQCVCAGAHEAGCCCCSHSLSLTLQTTDCRPHVCIFLFAFHNFNLSLAGIVGHKDSI